MAMWKDNMHIEICFAYHQLQSSSTSCVAYSRLSETRQSEGQSQQNPVRAYTTHQSIIPNELIRLDQFCYNCNIICLLSLKIPIRAYTTHQSISLNGLIRPEQFRKAWYSTCYTLVEFACVFILSIKYWIVSLNDSLFLFFSFPFACIYLIVKCIHVIWDTI